MVKEKTESLGRCTEKGLIRYWKNYAPSDCLMKT